MTQSRSMTWLGVAVLFAVLTIAMTWSMSREPGTLAPQHQDVFFNMWRLRWFAHAMATDPVHLFDANIFHPEKDTLAYSDAMLVEGLIAAPLAWLNPVLVHTVMMLLPIAASGVTMFALAWYLTGSRGAALIAGTAFAFAPFRFEHIMHMEIQWTIWMPLAFLALHRLLDGGRWRDGLTMGALVALQMLSCIYYGLFLGSLLSAGTLLLFLSDRRADWRRVLPPLAAAAAIAVVVSALYAIPYRHVHKLVGDRPIQEVHTFSAQPANYLSVLPGNWLYGNPARPGHAERHLYPGTIVTLLAIVGLLLQRPTTRQLAYLLLLALAFDMSIGFSGVAYPVLSRLASPFRSLRALSRLGIFVVMFLSVLAAYGYTIMTRAWRPTARLALCAVLVSGMLVEYWTTFAVAEFPGSAPPAYRVLAHLPKGVVAELPAPTNERLGFEGRRQYLSTFHWFPIVNGYSGNFPPSFLSRMERLHDFPSDRALRQLRYDDVAYVLVSVRAYTPAQLLTIHGRLAEVGMTALGTFDDGEGPAVLFARR
jgi:Bacterial membrane protein YfhO